MASKPKHIEIIGVHKNHVKLKWIKPDNDPEISEYEIEAIETSSKKWIKKGRVPACETAITVENLKEGKEYRFRVQAITKAGPGEYSEATMPVVVKSQLCEPLFIKKGEAINYRMYFQGEPKEVS